MKDKISMPLIEAMLQYKSEDVYPLHTPGHKGGRGMQRLLRQELGASVQMDVSLMSELDDIHEPETYIKEAQELAAQTYGSDACFWAVNGTSQAIHAMLLIALNPGEKLLLPRNAHRSVAGGLVLGGIEAVYLQPEDQPEFGIQMQVTVQQIEAALAQDSKIKAVLLTSPIITVWRQMCGRLLIAAMRIMQCCWWMRRMDRILASVNCCRHPLCSAVLMPVLRVRIKFWAR